MCKEHNQPYEIDCHLCMIVDARVLPSGTTLYSTSATDKSPVRARHTPTNRTTINHPSGAAMRPDSDPRQSRRTPYPHEFILILFRITEQTPGEAELNPELTARSASKHFPRSTSALPRKPERIHQPGTRNTPGHYVTATPTKCTTCGISTFPPAPPPMRRASPPVR